MLPDDEEALSAAMANKKPVVQKLRSATHTSRGWTKGRTSASKARSWAWPSSQGMTSVTIAHCGS